MVKRIPHFLLLCIGLLMCFSAVAEQDSIKMTNDMTEWKKVTLEPESVFYKKLMLETVLDYEYYRSLKEGISIVRIFSNFRMSGWGDEDKICLSRAKDFLLLSESSYPELSVDNKPEVFIVGVGANVNECQKNYVQGIYFRFFGPYDFESIYLLIKQFKLESVLNLCKIRSSKFSSLYVSRKPIQVLVDESFLNNYNYSGRIYIYIGEKNYALSFRSKNRSIFGIRRANLYFDDCNEN